MKADPARNFVLVEVRCDRVNNLLLQIAQVFALCGNAPRAARRIPGGYQTARFLVASNLESELVHLCSSISASTDPVNHGHELPDTASGLSIQTRAVGDAVIQPIRVGLGAKFGGSQEK